MSVISDRQDVRRMVLACLSSLGVGFGSVLPAIAQVNFAQFNPGAFTRPNRPDFFELGRQQFEEEIRQLEERQPDTMPILTVEPMSVQWFPVVLREGNCAVWMPPGSVTQENKVVETSQGAIAFEVTASQSNLGRFVVAFSEELAAATVANPNEVLERVRDRISGWQTGFGLDNERSLQVQGFPAKEFTLTSEAETITYRLIVAQERLYVLAVSQSTDATADAIAADAMQAFFESFKLL